MTDCVEVQTAYIADMMKLCLGAAKTQKLPRRNLLEKIRIGLDLFIC